eukprot:2240453-Pleurochrysis_carterae.AAC.2
MGALPPEGSETSELQQRIRIDSTPQDDEPISTTYDESQDDEVLKSDVTYEEEVLASVITDASENLHLYGDTDVVEGTVKAFLSDVNRYDIRLYEAHESQNVVSFVGDNNEFFVSVRGDELDKEALMSQTRESIQSIRSEHPNAKIALVSSDRDIVEIIVRTSDVTGYAFNEGANSSSHIWREEETYGGFVIRLTNKVAEVPTPEATSTVDDVPPLQSETVSSLRDMRRYGVLANAAYDNYFRSPESAEDRVQEYLPKHKVLAGYRSENYITFIRERTNSPSEIIISLRGTSPMNPEDLALAAKIAVGMSLKDTYRYNEARDVVRALRTQYPEASLSIVGHS